MHHRISRRQLLAGTAGLAFATALPLPVLAQGLPGPLSLSDAATPKGNADATALHAFFAEVYEADLSLSPETQTERGRKTAYDRWDDGSDAFADAAIARTRQALDLLRKGWKPSALPAADALNFRLFEAQCEAEIEAHRWRNQRYPINHLYGRHTGIPSFLANQHEVEDISDARAYLARLNGISAVIQNVIRRGEDAAARGVVPPKFSLTKMRPDIRSVITGAPFDQGPDSALYADFKKKIAALSIPQGEKDKLVAEAAGILTAKVKPAYEALDATVAKLEAKATQDDGVWKLPDGDAYYRFCVKSSTTTEMSPDEVHALGLKHVGLLQRDMHAIMQKVAFKGTLREFFEHLRSDPQFYFSNDDAGRAAYLAHCEKVIGDYSKRLDEWFITKPKAPVIVKRVEPYREKSAPPAFYNQPSPDGSRPGIFYANLADMREMAKWQADAIVYHEAIPGHHMQIAISQELGDVPDFRRYGFFGAYIEGWGLYAERLPKEYGFYQDPYADFGRLTTQIWRAVRLVVDSGIHAKRWTREQAITYFVENTPLNRDQVIREVDRYIVSPGQATSYYVGMLKILDLRDKAKQALGAKFDLRAFHDLVLRTGAVPLEVLGEQVEAWIKVKKG
ncbi:DUF885 domain-containing protein [Niveispirillum sp. KHB5.9]|uniref:DUF885 domain-containing protein n=1 Tax=Niveispirillum sp. KHB5.9 TaxID=3400269 RepID=UPI003A8A291E